MEVKRMNSEKKNKKEPWRIILFIISVLFILFMWIKKDIVSIYTTMPEEQVLPLMVTTIAVSLVKVIAIAGGILLIKLLVGKFGKK